MISPYDQIAAEQLRPGVTLRRPKHDTSVMQVVEATYEAGTPMRPDHTHDISEVYYIVSGRLRLSLAGEEATLGPGSFFYIPAGTPHEITEFLERTVLVNVTTPEHVHEHHAAPGHGDGHDHGHSHGHGHDHGEGHGR